MHGQTQRTLAARARHRIVHASVLAGLLLFAAVTLYLSGRASGSARSESATVLMKYVGLVVLAGSMLAVMLFRPRISAPRAGGDLDDWWLSNSRYVTSLWALADAGGLACVVLGWLTQDNTLLVSGVVVAVLLLLWCRPGSLEARR